MQTSDNSGKPPRCEVSCGMTLTLAELYDRHIQPALPSCDSVKRWDSLLRSLVKGQECLLVRKTQISNEDVRGKPLRSKDGCDFYCTDNAPLWYSVYLAFACAVPSLEDWRCAIAALKQEWHSNELERKGIWKEAKPSWLECRDKGVFQIPVCRNQVLSKIGGDHHNRSRWHFAHIVTVNDRSDPLWWSKENIERKFLRFIHPINCVLLPLAKWRDYGGRPDVLCYMGARYRERYGSLWDCFLKSVGAEAQCPISEGEKLKLAATKLKF